VAKGISTNVQDRMTGAITRPMAGQQLPDRGASGARFTKRNKIMFADQSIGRFIHGIEVKPAMVARHLMAAERIYRARVITNAIGVAPEQRGEACIKSVFNDANFVDCYVIGE